MSPVGISLAIPALDRLGTISYVFTTRRKGLGSRTDGIKSPDDWNPVAEDLGIAAGRVVTVNQVHGDAVVRVDASNLATIRSMDADVLITRERDIAIGVETADCVPILLVDPLLPAVGAVHAGWRSTVKKIVQKATAAMQEEFGTDPRRLIAAIGPSIGPECSEVDEPVMGPLREAFSSWKEVAWPRENNRWSLDLARLNRLELIQAGVPQVNI